MKSAGSRVLTINGGSSSIKFALFEVGAALRQILGGELERIGLPETTLRVKGSNPADNFSRPMTAADHTAAVGVLMEWIEKHSGRDALAAVGHRVVHGGPKYSKPQQGHRRNGRGAAPVQSLRSGASAARDLDPGLVSYLARTEQMSAAQFQKMVNHESGLLGASETSSDMRDLLERETQDVRAAEAVALFCYQAKKWIGAFAAALGGLDTLVFAGGIGENAPPVRERICDGLGFLASNSTGSAMRRMRRWFRRTLSASRCGSSADEELMIARSVAHLLVHS
jgi:acetate kinase